MGRIMCVKCIVYKRGKEEGDIHNGKIETEIDIVLIRKKHWHFLRDLKGIVVVFQHALVVADIGWMVTRNVERKTCVDRR